MTNHLTEDQISRWIAGRRPASELRHMQGCHTCTCEVDRLGRLLDLFRDALADRAERRAVWASRSLASIQANCSTAHALFGTGVLLKTPPLLESLKRALLDTFFPPKVQTLVAPLEVHEIWSNDHNRYAGILSLFAHVAVLAVLVIPVAALDPPPPSETSVMMLRSAPLIFEPQKGRASGGGGGGGMRTPTAPSRGLPPRGADKQLTPPLVEPKNLMPELTVESTVVAPQLAHLPQFNFNTIGDPNGVVGPPSAGPGVGGGIGTGAGRGVGGGTGRGVGPGDGGGFGGGVFNVGGGVSEPRIRYKLDPEYSEDGRKARAQGTVEMLIVVREDGSVEFRELTKRLGYGLDQRAVDAVRKWRFEPGRKDGMPVAVFVSVVVNFALR